MSIYAEIRAERERAHAKHGEQSMETQPIDAPIRMTILMEEVGEVAREFNEAQSGTLDRASLRAELVQVAAMATAWADAIDPPPAQQATAQDATRAGIEAAADRLHVLAHTTPCEHSSLCNGCEISVIEHNLRVLLEDDSHP